MYIYKRVLLFCYELLYRETEAEIMMLFITSSVDSNKRFR